MEEALLAHWLADPALQAHVDSRINFGRRVQGEPLPAIVVHSFAGPRSYLMSGPGGLRRPRVQVDCLATTWLAARTIGRAVIANAEAVKDEIVQGVRFNRLFVIDDETDPHDDETLGTIYRNRLDLRVWHAQP